MTQGLIDACIARTHNSRYAALLFESEGRKTMIIARNRVPCAFQMTRTSDIVEEFEVLIDDDIIHEKDIIALVVGLESETRFIFNHEPDK
jgi:hypothetical protein